GRPHADPLHVERAGGGDHGVALGADRLVLAHEGEIGAVGGDGEPGPLGDGAGMSGGVEVTGRDMRVAGPLDALESGRRGVAHHALDVQLAEGDGAQARADHADHSDAGRRWEAVASRLSQAPPRGALAGAAVKGCPKRAWLPTSPGGGLDSVLPTPESSSEESPPAVTTTLPAPTRPAISRVMPWLLLLLTVFGPISMDLYLPALPALTRELEATTSVAQLTVTACLLGLAAGQVLAGPASDQHGRRRLLLIGVAAYVLTSVLCAVSPSIELLVAARFVQGVAGGVGIVIAQAAGRDLFEGRELIRFYGRLAVAGPTAAIIGPVIGGMLNTVVDWRGLFGFLALVGVVLLVLSATLFTE